MTLLATGTLSTLPTWILVVLGLAAVWRLSRGGGGSAVSELSKANEVLTKRVHELGAEVRDLRIENAALKERTDVTLAIEPAVARITERMERSFALHEERAIERHRAMLNSTDKQLVVLGMIADKLEPEAA